MISFRCDAGIWKCNRGMYGTKGHPYVFILDSIIEFKLFDMWNMAELVGLKK